MKRRLAAVFGGIVLAVSMAATAMAAPIVCPGAQTPAHNGGDWYCVAPSGEPTGAGWHKGTGDKL